MAYFGKEFVLDRSENLEAFIDSIGGIPPEMKQASLNFKPVTKIEKNGDTYTFTTSKLDGTTSVTTFKSGEEKEEVVFERKANVITTVNGNTFTQVMKFDDGTFTFTREFSDNELVVTLAHDRWDGQAKRYYKLK